MKIVLSILFYIKLSLSFGQAIPVDSTQAVDLIPANLISLVGFWVSTDTSEHTIEFRYKKNWLTMASGNGQLFDFMNQDSLFPAPISGVIIQWPPNYCSVYQADPVHIEIQYGFFGSPGITVCYKRLEKKNE